MLAFGLWIFGRYATPFKPKRTKLVARFATIAVIGLSGWFASQAIRSEPRSQNFSSESEKFGIAWQGFDPRKIVQERKKGRTIFIDFTADW